MILRSAVKSIGQFTEVYENHKSQYYAANGAGDSLKVLAAEGTHHVPVSRSSAEAARDE